MQNITGVWVSHEVAPHWRVRIEVLTAVPTETEIHLEHDGTSWLITRDAKGNAWMAGRPGWAASVPVGVRKIMTLILESQEHGTTASAVVQRTKRCGACGGPCVGQCERF